MLQSLLLRIGANRGIIYLGDLRLLRVALRLRWIDSSVSPEVVDCWRHIFFGKTSSADWLVILILPVLIRLC